MPKSKPMPRNVRRRGGRLDAGTVQVDPTGNRASRRAAAKRGVVKHVPETPTTDEAGEA